MHSRHFNDIANLPVLADNAETGDYGFFETTPDSMNTMLISLNLTHKDPVLREVFQNKDFRIGLSHAMDRQEIIDVVHAGQGQPWQTAPRPESELYDEEMATQYTEHDVDLANEHLDAAGYDQRDADGFRLGPDGQRIAFTVDVTAGQDDRIDALEFVQRHWEAVGIDMRIDTMDRSLFYIRIEDNDHDAAVWGGDGGLNPTIRPVRYFPMTPDGSRFAPAWAHWYVGNPQGEEPPEGPRRQMELYDQVIETADPDERHQLMEEFLRIAKEEFYDLGTSLPVEGYGIVKNNFHNVPDLMPSSWPYPDPGPSNPEQYFIQDE